MKTIYKYKLKPGFNKIEMPLGAEVLTAQVQKDEICVWAMVDKDSETEIRGFEVYGDGHDVVTGMGVSREYLSTVQLYNGSLVFHVFEYTGV